ncbi:hypothetical protein TD95_002489 [Thielaviopsis punctulata]|uniref:Thioesterase domain-containing protein n=1 Tax=Thielaviopsis punctulata TaxID=72032 RepID=A0A0F4ZE89_9PEZI|nr:hypothetical protein TD95_002489 [Thielaviopsis punctulata]
MDALQSRRQRCLYAPTPEERFAAWLSPPSSPEESAVLDYGLRLLPFAKLKSFATTPVLRCVFTYTVQDGDCNPINLHGGCIATLIDMLTSLSLVPVQKPGFWEFLGVSRTLNVTYLSPVGAGETVTVECEVVSLGKRSCHLTAVLKSEDGRVVATGTHDKVDLHGVNKL